MSKRGEGAPRNNDQGGNDVWLKWIDSREKQINASNKDKSEKNDYLNMLEELRDYRVKQITPEIEYKKARSDATNLIDSRLKEVTHFINNKAKKDPEFAKKAKEQIRERQREHDRALREMESYDLWLERNKDRSDAQAWDDQHKRIKKIYGYASETQEPDAYFQQEQETKHDYEDRLTKNESMAIITAYIPKSEAAKFIPEIFVDNKHPGRINVPYSKETGAKKYFDLIKEVYEQFPRKERENREDYRRRIETASANGNLQFAVVKSVVDPKSEVGQETNERIEAIEELEKKATSSPLSAQEKADCQKELQKEKLELYKKAIDAIQYSVTEKEARDRGIYLEDLRVKHAFDELKKEKAQRKKARYQWIGRLARLLSRNKK